MDWSFRGSLDGKVGVVTGAARGIGRAVALALAANGVRVAALDREASGCQETVAALTRDGGEGEAQPVDVAEKASLERALSAVADRFGGIDLLVHCAGILRVGPFLEVAEPDWRAVVEVNLTGTFLTCQAAARRMVVRGGGAIVAIASNAALVPRIHNAAYGAAKAGVLHLVRIMALELARHRIRVNALCPGTTETAMITQTAAAADPNFLRDVLQGNPEKFRTGIPLGRLARPDEQAAMALFLVSDFGAHITGQTFTVDGGQTIH